MDPLAEKYYSISPYAYCKGNPINMIDPTGMQAWTSTQTDENGKVIAVYNDGDLGVYKHKGVGAEAKKEIDENYSSTNTSAGGEWMGETAYWDEFVDRNHNGELKRNSDGSYIPYSNSQIFFDQSWDFEIDYMNTYSNQFSSLSDLALGSMPNGFYDIKSRYKSGTGKKLNGKFATAESAGNFLAGKNAASRIGFDLYMRLAGALHYGGKFALLNCLLTGKEYGSYPWYGEINYCARNVIEGWLSNPKGNDRKGALQRSRLMNLTK